MKKQLNYKSLNTLGDVDITQSVVPGGGEENESGGVKFRYFDASKLGNSAQAVVSYYTTLLQATKDDGTKTILCLGSMLNSAPVTPDGSIAAVITDTKVVSEGGEFLTFEETCAEYGITEEALQVGEITKEEFYKLPVALTIYSSYWDYKDHQDEMKTTFDTLWAIWERDGVEGQDLAITIPNADIASITEISNEGTFAFNITSMRGGTTTSDSDTVTYIEFNGQYGPQIRKVENLITGEITYEHYYAA